MADVYKIGMSMQLGGNLAGELTRMLKAMEALDKRSKEVAKSIGLWRQGITQTAAQIQGVQRSMAGITSGARSAGSAIGVMASSAGAASRHLQQTRSHIVGLSTAASGVSRTVGNWSSRLANAANQASRLRTALTNLPAPPAMPRYYVPRAAAPGAPGAPVGRGTYYGGAGPGSGLAAGVGAYGGYTAGRAVLGESAGRVRENARALNSGMTEEQNRSLAERAMQMQTQYPALSGLGIRETGRLLIPNVGDYGKAMELLPEFLKGQVALATAAGGIEKGKEDMERLSRFTDIVGRSMSLSDTKALIDGFVRARQLDSSAISGNDYVTAAGTLSASGKSLDVNFLSSVLPALIAQSKGAKSGTMIASAYQNAMIGRGTDASLIKQDESGWRLGMDHNGRKVRRRGSLVDEELYGSNPYEWAKRHMVPDMAKRGILPEGYAKGDYSQELSQDQRTAAAKYLSDRFSNRKGADLFAMLIPEMAQIEKNIAQMKRAAGTGNVGADQKNDPYLALEGVTNQLKNFGAVLLEPGIQNAGPVLASLAGGLAQLNLRLSESPALNQLASGAAVTGLGIGAATVHKMVSNAMGRGAAYLGMNPSGGIMGTLGRIGSLTRGGLMTLGMGLGLQTAIGPRRTNEAYDRAGQGLQARSGTLSPEELAQIRANGDKALARVGGWLKAVAPSFGSATMGPGIPSQTPGAAGMGAAAEEIKRAQQAMSATGAAAGTAAEPLGRVQGNLAQVPGAASSAASAIMGLIESLRSAAGAAAGAAGAVGGGMSSPAAPGIKKSAALAPGGAGVGPIRTDVHLDGRKIASAVSRSWSRGGGGLPTGSSDFDGRSGLPATA